MKLLTLPNLLTGLRFILVPLFLYLFLSNRMELQLLSTFVFILAAITDHIDGRIARRYRQVTQVGKFADPLADKLLTLTGFIAIVLCNEFAAVAVYLGVWVAIIALREIVITLLRIWAVKRETPVITSIWGKAKTTIQLFTIIFTLVILNFRQITLKIPESKAFYPGDTVVTYIVHALIFICMVITVVSGIIYFNSSRFEPKNSSA